MTATLGAGNTPVVYTGTITPNANTFRLGGGGGRLILPNASTLSGANDLHLYGGGNTAGQVFLTGAYGFTGNTTVNAGTTIINTVANGGAASSLGAGSAAATGLVLNGGTLQYVGSGSSSNRLFTLSAAPTTLDSSGTGPIALTGTGAVAFLNSGNRTLTVQGNNTGANSIAAAIGDSILVAGTSGTLNHGVTTLVKGGNGTWFLGGANTFSGGVTVNNGVLGFTSAGAIGANTVNGPASVLVNAGGAVALGGSLTTGIQTTLNRISPISTGTVALTADTAEGINFDGGSAGAGLPQALLGAYGNVTYTGTLTPFGTAYRLGGGGGVLAMPNGGLTGPRQVIIGGGGPGTSFVNNPNLNGAVVLGGASDYSGGTVLGTGAILSATSVAALGSGPLKFQGGVYRAVDTTDFTLASDGVSARDVRLGFDSQTGVTANIDVVSGVNLALSKTLGAQPAFGSNQGQAALTKYGAGTLTLNNGLNLAITGGAGSTNTGLFTIERGTASIVSNPTFYAGNIQVGSNNGGVGTLKLGANNVFGTGTVATGASIIDVYNGSNLDLNGFSDTIRIVRGMGSIINSGASSANLTVGSNSEQGILGGHLVGNFTLTMGGNQASTPGASGSVAGVELMNVYNSGFTGKLVANAGAIRIRGDGTLGATTEAFAADKITLNNGGVLINGTTAFNPIIIGANHGITLGANGGTISVGGTSPMIVNAPITGSGMLTIGDETGTVFLASNNNTYTGGTTISSANTRGFISIGAGGTTGNLPAGNFFFNSAAGGGRLYTFHSNDITIPNNINGPGLVLQIGAGTTTLTGNNTNYQVANASSTFVGGGRLKADFTGGNAPIATGTGLTVSAGTFEYAGASGDNILRLGALAVTAFGGPAAFNGGFIGDAAVQSTYGGSGTQQLVLNGNSRGTAGTTMNFVTSGGVNGVTNSIVFEQGPAVKNAIGAAFFYNGADFAAVDSSGFVRAADYGNDLNTNPLNSFANVSRYSKLTTSVSGQASIALSGIVLSGAGTNLNLAAASVLTTNANPGTLLKSGGGLSVVDGGAGASIANNGQELILRTDTAGDSLRIDVPITGTGALTKSGNGTLTLTAANTYTGSTFLDSGSVLVTGNGVIGSTTNGTSVRLANAAGSTVTVTMDSATSSIIAGGTTQNDSLRIAEAGTATLIQSAGTVTANQFVTIGDNLGSVGTYNMSGGILNVKASNAATPALVVGRAGTGTFNISDTAAVTVKNGAQVLLGSGIVTSTAVTFQGAIPNLGTQTGNGTITQTGGTLTVETNNNTFQSNVYGAVIVGLDGTGTYNLNGGTLTTPLIGRGNGVANFNLGGGTLKAPTPVGTLPSIFNTDLAMNLTGTGAGKGTLDTNGNDVAVTGILSGVGGLKKASNGVLSILGSGSYSGGTDVTGGSIVASGTSLGTGVVTLSGGTSLNVQGVQRGLLAKFSPVVTSGFNPLVTTGSTAGMASEWASLSAFNTFMAGKPLIAVESTAARGKVSVNYLDIGGANQNTALPPAVIALSNGANVFIAKLDGKFNAATTGDYTFQTRSDDGSVLFVDGQPVLDNNRSQGQVVRTGTIGLTAGLHDITVGYYQGTGGGGFSVGVTLPGQGQSFLVGAELNMSNDLLSFGSNDITVGGLAGSGTLNTVTGGTVTDSNAADADFAGVLNGNAAFVKAGLGKQILSGNNAASFTGAVTVADGTLEVAGSITGSAVTVSGATATLSGDGAVGALTVTNGTVAPGNSTIGSLDTANFGLTGGTLSLEIGSVSSYDSVNTTGSVTLGGNLVLNVGAGPFIAGDTFTIISNDGVDAVGGTFAGLAEGATFTSGYFDFTVSYVGGTGNDVTLVVPEPGSAALLLGGLAMLAGRRRRNTRA